jgi:DNA-binding transcriptional ArsR family regulator
MGGSVTGGRRVFSQPNFQVTRCIMPTPEELKVLKLLAKEWDYSGPPGLLDVSDIVAAVDLAPSETLQTLKDLFTRGLVDMNELKTSAFLTPEGYEATEIP